MLTALLHINESDSPPALVLAPSKVDRKGHKEKESIKSFSEEPCIPHLSQLIRGMMLNL